MDQQIDVLVVGAGPVGMWTALRLRQLGVQKILPIDRTHRMHLHSYALALHGRTLELLEKADLLQEVLARGHRIERIALYEGDRLQAELDLTALPGSHPYVLVLPQSTLEAIFEHHLRAHHTPVRWQEELLEAEMGPRSVRARIGTISQGMQGYPILELVEHIGHLRDLEARFVVGADGLHSRMRQLLEIDYPLLGEPTYCTFFEFHTAESLPDEMRLQFDGALRSALWPIGQGRYRWIFQIEAAEADRPISSEWFDELLRSRAPWWADVPREVVWMSKACFEPRLAERFGSGRCWLLGDAAHLTWPFGVQSMNRGIEEGEALARALHGVLHGGAPETALEIWAEEARRSWEALLGITAQPEDAGASAWILSHRFELLYSLPATGTDLEMLLHQVGLRWRAS
jgi:2-polyprenyl-6-methoxyphenol hydroxylase-like FAD-dependent oxidoreductase|nr:MAG: pentachlorophenol monooxygenase [Bacteroidota bacterium]